MIVWIKELGFEKEYLIDRYIMISFTKKVYDPNIQGYKESVGYLERGYISNIKLEERRYPSDYRAHKMEIGLKDHSITVCTTENKIEEIDGKLFLNCN